MTPAERALETFRRSAATDPEWDPDLEPADAAEFARLVAARGEVEKRRTRAAQRAFDAAFRAHQCASSARKLRRNRRRP